MMKRWFSATAALLLTVGLLGCPSQRQPELRDARITPPVLQPGDSALITTEVLDRFDIVDRVTVVVNEAEGLAFDLHDDGLEGDVRADDDIWSFWVEVPLTAPPGEYDFVMTAFSDKGNMVLVRDKEGSTVPLAASFSCTIGPPGASGDAPSVSGDAPSVSGDAPSASSDAPS
jgi:hypothetical protein